MAGELDELELINNYFFDLMLADEEFKTLFSSTKIASRIGQPMVEQGAAFPLVNIRDLGAYDGGLLRPVNSGVEFVWAQRQVLVVAANEGRRYPGELAKRMRELFLLRTQTSVTGGTIFHCYLSPLEGFYKNQYPDKSGSKIISEKGSVWIIAAKSS